MMHTKAINRSRQRCRDVLIGVGITILLVFIAEVGARGYFWLKYQRCAELGRRHYGFNLAGYGDLMPDQDGMWTIWPHRPYHVQTNAAGLRNVEPLNEGGSSRILAIGDSMTFGPYVANEDTWPGWLQVILRQRLGRNDIQVLNAGIAGYNIEDELSYFRDKGQALTPDVVILGFFPNDIPDLRPSGRLGSRPAAENVGVVRRFLEDHVALYRVADRIKSRVLIAIARSQIDDETREQANRSSQDILYVHPDLPAYHTYYERYETMLRDLIAEVNAANSRLVIVAIPEYLQIPADAYPDHPQRFVQAIADDTDTPYLDLLPAFRAAGEIDDLYLLAYHVEVEPDADDPFFAEHTRYVGNGHLSRFGYRVAARAIADFLFAQGLISSDAP